MRAARAVALAGIDQQVMPVQQTVSQMVSGHAPLHPRPCVHTLQARLASTGKKSSAQRAAGGKIEQSACQPQSARSSRPGRCLATAGMRGRCSGARTVKRCDGLCCRRTDAVRRLICGTVHVPDSRGAPRDSVWAGAVGCLGEPPCFSSRPSAFSGRHEPRASHGHLYAKSCRVSLRCV